MYIEEKLYEAYKTSELRHLHPKEDLVFACSKSDYDLYNDYIIELMELEEGWSLYGEQTYLGIELKVFDTDTIKIILK